MLTDLCFKEEREETADIIFLFGTNICRVEAAQLLSSLLRRGISKRLLVTGGITNFRDERNQGYIESDISTLLHRNLHQQTPLRT